MIIGHYLSNPIIFSLIRPVLHRGFEGRKKIIQEFSTAVNDKVIDIACGVGTFCSCIQGEYTGIDINPDFIKFAKEKYKKNFLVADATNLKMFSDKSFDKALVIDCIHHMGDDKVKKLLGEVCRIIKGKALIIDVTDETKKSLIGNFLLKMDLGHSVRSSFELKKIINYFFTTEKEVVFDSGFYKEMAIIATPKD